jgi:NADP-dependent 3-hydroxy acid dehydrogenase YdfG
MLRGKVALVTGASKGIGRATTLRLVRDGVKLAVCATSRELLESIDKEVENDGSQVLARYCDVAQEADCRALVEEAINKFGKIDILVNNAGLGYSGKIVELAPEDAEKMVRVNILGVYFMTHAVLPTMIAHNRGDIVNIGSVAGLKYSPGFALYSATKFAVKAFSEGLRNEVQEHNIRVTTVHPGMVSTNFFDSFSRGGVRPPTDKGDLLSPEDVAESIHFALTRPRSVALNELTVRPYWQER